MITHTSTHTKQIYTPIFTLIVTVPHIIHSHVHTLKDTCVHIFTPRTLRLTATHTHTHTYMCRYHIPTQLCIHTLIYTHTQEYVPTRPHTHLVAMTLFITDPWALTDTCRSARTHKQTQTHTQLSASLRRTAPTPPQTRSPPLWVFLPPLTVGLSCAMTDPRRAAVPHRACPCTLSPVRALGILRVGVHTQVHCAI